MKHGKFSDITPHRLVKNLFDTLEKTYGVSREVVLDTLLHSLFPKAKFQLELKESKQRPEYLYIEFSKGSKLQKAKFYQTLNRKFGEQEPPVLVHKKIKFRGEKLLLHAEGFIQQILPKLFSELKVQKVPFSSSYAELASKFFLLATKSPISSSVITTATPSSQDITLSYTGVDDATKTLLEGFAKTITGIVDKGKREETAKKPAEAEGFELLESTPTLEPKDKDIPAGWMTWFWGKSPSLTTPPTTSSTSTEAPSTATNSLLSWIYPEKSTSTPDLSLTIPKEKATMIQVLSDTLEQLISLPSTEERKVISKDSIQKRFFKAIARKETSHATSHKPEVGLTTSVSDLAHVWQNQDQEGREKHLALQEKQSNQALAQQRAEREAIEQALSRVQSSSLDTQFERTHVSRDFFSKLGNQFVVALTGKSKHNIDPKMLSLLSTAFSGAKDRINPELFLQQRQKHEKLLALQATESVSVSSTSSSHTLAQPSEKQVSASVSSQKEPTDANNNITIRGYVEKLNQGSPSSHLRKVMRKRRESYAFSSEDLQKLEGDIKKHDALLEKKSTSSPLL